MMSSIGDSDLESRAKELLRGNGGFVEAATLVLGRPVEFADKNLIIVLAGIREADDRYAYLLLARTTEDHSRQD